MAGEKNEYLGLLGADDAERQACEVAQEKDEELFKPLQGVTLGLPLVPLEQVMDYITGQKNALNAALVCSAWCGFLNADRHPRWALYLNQEFKVPESHIQKVASPKLLYRQLRNVANSHYGNYFASALRPYLQHEIDPLLLPECYYPYKNDAAKQFTAALTKMDQYDKLALLHRSIGFGNVALFRTLVNIYKVVPDQEALFLTAYTGDLEWVQFILERNRELSATDPFLLDCALQSGSKMLVAWLLDEKGNHLESIDVFTVIRKGCTHLLRYLVEERKLCFNNPESLAFQLVQVNDATLTAFCLEHRLVDSEALEQYHADNPNNDENDVAEEQDELPAVAQVLTREGYSGLIQMELPTQAEELTLLLNLALDRGDIASAWYLIERGAEPGESTITGAMNSDAFFVCRHLIQTFGLQVTDVHLISAVMRNHLAFLRYFVEHCGVAVTVQNYDQGLGDDNSPAVMAYLLDQLAQDQNILEQAIQAEDYRLVYTLISKGLVVPNREQLAEAMIMASENEEDDDIRYYIEQHGAVYDFTFEGAQEAYDELSSELQELINANRLGAGN